MQVQQFIKLVAKLKSSLLFWCEGLLDFTILHKFKDEIELCKVFENFMPKENKENNARREGNYEDS